MHRLLLLPLVLAGQTPADTPPGQILVSPAALRLQGPGAVHSLLLDAKTADGRLVDVSRGARFQTRDAKVAGVSEAGVVRAVGDGATVIDIDVQGGKLAVPVVV